MVEMSIVSIPHIHQNQMTFPRVAVIILNWNGIDDTSECLQSLKELNYPVYDVIVVDNGSAGEDVKVLKNCYSDYIHLIQNRENKGFAEGNNIGIRYALAKLNPDYLVILNNDTIVAPDFLYELVKVAQSDTTIGIIGPKIYYYNFQQRDNVIWFAGGRIRWWRWVRVYTAQGQNRHDQARYQAIRCVDWVAGSAMMIGRHVVDESLFLNPRYFFGLEDIEYCLRAQKRGFKVVYVPDAIVWHKVNRARKKYDPSFADLSSYYYFLKQNFSNWVYIYHLAELPIILAYWTLVYLLKRRDKKHWVFSGVI